MVERHVSFRVLPDRGAEFERFVIERYAPAMSVQPGFAGLSLLRERDIPGRYHMVIRFQSRQESDQWRSSDSHKTLSPSLKALHLGAEAMDYIVAHET